jgi:hypothetical protein
LNKTLNCKSSYLDQAIELLRRFNGLTFTDGHRVSESVIVDGFEPWWFIQEQLFWNFLVPYSQHRIFINRWIKGEILVNEAVPDQLDCVLRLLEKIKDDAVSSSSDTAKPLSLLARNVRRVLGKAFQFGLAVFSITSLFMFRLLRKDTLLYTIDKLSKDLDHDFRITGIYRELRQRGYRFSEYIHFSNLSETCHNLFKRHRPEVFFEAVIDTILFNRGRSRKKEERSFKSSSDTDQQFITALAEEAIRRCEVSVRGVRILKTFLKLQGVRCAVVLDDSRHANELIAACKSLHVPILGYMHGLLNRYHVGLMAYEFGNARRHTFDLYGIWSEYFRQRILKGSLYDAENTFVCGPLRPPTKMQLRECEYSRKRNIMPVRVLLISEPRAQQEQVHAYVERLLDDGRFKILIKIRIGEHKPNFNPDRYDPNSWQIVGGTVFEAVAESDVVVGTYGTMLYEAAWCLRPAVVLNTDFQYGQDLVYDDLAEFAKSPECVCDVVMQASSLPEEELRSRRSIIWGDCLVDGAVTLFDRAENRIWVNSNHLHK